MRVAPLLLWCLLCACDSRSSEPVSARKDAHTAAPPRMQRLSLEGVSVEAPATFIALDAEAVEELKAGGRREDPNAALDLVALRAPSHEADGLVYVQTGRSGQRPRAAEATVQALLEGEVEALRKKIAAHPLELVDFRTDLRGDAIEYCAVVRLAVGEPVLNRACGVFFARPDAHLSSLAVACLSREALAKETCEPIIASRKFTPGDRLPLDRVLPPPAP